MRSLVSYDDIASQAPEQGQTFSTYTSEPGSPPKKRRKNNRQGQRQRNQYNEDKSAPKTSQRDHGFKEESRRLTHEDIWDDSALIRAWDAAVEEYEALNGPDKKWKSEPVNKSALWFNTPPEPDESSVSPGPSFLVPSIPAAFATQSEEQGHEPESADPDNSLPVNFDTFVPRHDPTLSQIGIAQDEQTRASNITAPSSYTNIIPPPHPGVSGQVSKDEAFQQAIGAWYWAGYWTGIYHGTGISALPDAAQVNEEGEQEHEKLGDAVDGAEDEQEEDIIVDGSSSDEARADEEDLIPT